MSRGQLRDLSFLESVFPELDQVGQDRYTTARWLRDDFGSDEWTCEFGPRRVQIDWRVVVGSFGGLLTDTAHAELLRTFKCWLILSTHSDIQRGAIWGPSTEFRRFSTTLDWIDFFLVRADRFTLAETGLAHLSRDELSGALFTLATCRWKSDGIYEFSSRLGAHLRSEGARLSAARIRNLIAEHPFIAADLPPREDRVTDLTDDEVIAARAALWDGGLYTAWGSDGTYEWYVPLAALVPRLYAGTIRGSRGKRKPVELNLIPDDRTVREAPAAPVTRGGGDGLTAPRFGEYERALRELGLLANVGLPVPISSLRTLSTEDAVETSGLRDTARYRTPPPEVVFSAIRRAIEFVLSSGDAIVDAYVAAAATVRAGLTISGAVQREIEYMNSRDANELGVTRWTVRDIALARWRGPGISGCEYYAQLRKNVGLWDLIRVLFGAVQVIVGALTARRISELTGLDATGCVDSSRTYLVFENAKSGVGGHRETIARPIPPIAVRAIELIQRLHQSMLDSGHVQQLDRLFAPPSARQLGLVQPTSAVYLASLDMFFDYIEMPSDDEGRRYYLRQHQLRRFFAMVFFWSNSFGGMDTLREFLGHTDVNHLYRYITESTPGEVLRGVKAEWAAEALREQVSAADELADLVEQHFGTRQFKLLGSEDLSDYVEGLLACGRVHIEPEFLDAHGSYRIAVRVTTVEACA